jgi:hypothetical protein
MTKEEIRLAESGTRKKHWKRWGPYLSEHVWGTVREDYSLHGNAWEYLPHDHARSRAYRWNEEMSSIGTRSPAGKPAAGSLGSPWAQRKPRRRRWLVISRLLSPRRASR